MACTGACAQYFWGPESMSCHHYRVAFCTKTIWAMWTWGRYRVGAVQKPSEKWQGSRRSDASRLAPTLIVPQDKIAQEPLLPPAPGATSTSYACSSGSFRRRTEACLHMIWHTYVCTENVQFCNNRRDSRPGFFGHLSQIRGPRQLLWSGTPRPTGCLKPGARRGWHFNSGQTNNIGPHT